MLIIKPWGSEDIFTRTNHYVGKKIFIASGKRLSYQYHKTKHESMYFISGVALIELGDYRERRTVKAGDCIYIPPEMKHRVTAISNTEIIEISTPQLDDVVRLEDDYGRS